MNALLKFLTVLAVFAVACYALTPAFPRGNAPEPYLPTAYKSVLAKIDQYITPDMNNLAAEAAHVKAIELASGGDVGGSIPYFKIASQKNAYNPAYHNNLGVSLMRHSYYSEALGCFLSSLYLSPSNEDAIGNLLALFGLWPDMPVDRVISAVLNKYTHDSDGYLLNWVDAVKVEGAVGGYDLSGNKHYIHVYNTAVDTHHRAQAREVSASVGVHGEIELDSLDVEPVSTDTYPSPDKYGHTTTNTNPRARLPRIHFSDLNKPENVKYRLGQLPFIVTGVFDSTGNTRMPMDLDYFSEAFATSTVDFYPQNMGEVNNKPYLVSMKEAVKEIIAPTGAYNMGKGSYIQFNVNEKNWGRLTADLNNAVSDIRNKDTVHTGQDNLAVKQNGLPKLCSLDSEWLYTCINKHDGDHDVSANIKSPNQSPLNEFTLKLHWRMVVIGTKHAGMFNHMDVLRTGSYQIQLHGAKKWHLCAPDQRAFMYGVGVVDAFNPDYHRYPLFKYARCWEDTVEEGMIVFYPKDYWHQTYNLATPTISMSSSLLNHDSFQEIREELRGQCAFNKYNWGFSKALCQDLTEKCFPLWDSLYNNPDQLR